MEFLLVVVAIVGGLWLWGALTRWAWRPDPKLDGTPRSFLDTKK